MDRSPFSIDSSPPLTGNEMSALRSKQIFFDGVFKGDYSLDLVNRLLARELIALGLDVTCFVREADWADDLRLNEMPDVKARIIAQYPEPGAYDIHLRNHWPPDTEDMIGVRNAYVCFAWEEIEVPAYMVERFSRDLDLLMVTANFVEQACLHSGVTCPVVTVGDGCDHVLQIEPADQPPIPLTGRRRILHVSSCLPRKGADLLLRAYAETYLREDGVELVIKTHPNPDNQIHRQIAEIRSRYPNCPPIEVYEHSLTAAELAALYRSADVLVAPSRGEGFGLPLAEALLSGVPVVTTNYSGQVDFCNDQTSYPVDYRLVPSQAHVSGSYSLWAEPLVSSLGAQIRAALDRPDEAKDRARRGAEAILRHFTWRHVATRVATGLARCLDGPGPAVTARPWRVDLVSTWRQRCGIATYSEHLFGTDRFAPRLSRVLCRDVPAADLLPGRRHPTDATAAEVRSWSDEWSGILKLCEEMSRGTSEVLWFQHHPGHFSAGDMEHVGRAARNGPYKLTVVTLHNVATLAREQKLQWLLLFDLIFVHNAADAAMVSAVGHKHVYVVPHGILMPPRAEPHGPGAADPSDARSDRQDFTIGTFGFLTPHKHVEVLVDAVARIRRIIPEVRLKILNCTLPDHESRLTRARIETLIEVTGLRDAVDANFDFLEEQQIIRELRNCDLLAFLYGPSDESASGAARIGLMADRPILCSSSGALVDVHGTAHVIDDLRSEHVASVLLALMSNRDLLSVHDENRRRFVDAYSYESLSRRYLHHVSAALEGS